MTEAKEHQRSPWNEVMAWLGRDLNHPGWVPSEGADPYLWCFYARTFQPPGRPNASVIFGVTEELALDPLSHPTLLEMAVGKLDRLITAGEKDLAAL